MPPKNTHLADRRRLAESLVGRRVKFAHQVHEPQSHLVTSASADGMVELEGWTGLFGPEAFHVVANADGITRVEIVVSVEGEGERFTFEISGEKLEIWRAIATARGQTLSESLEEIVRDFMAQHPIIAISRRHSKR